MRCLLHQDIHQRQTQLVPTIGKVKNTQQKKKKKTQTESKKTPTPKPNKKHLSTQLPCEGRRLPGRHATTATGQRRPGHFGHGYPFPPPARRTKQADRGAAGSPGGRLAGPPGCPAPSRPATREGPLLSDRPATRRHARRRRPCASPHRLSAAGPLRPRRGKGGVV